MKRTLFRFLLWGLVPGLLLAAAGLWYGLYHVAPYAIILPQRPAPQDPVYRITPASLGLSAEPFRVDAGDSVVLDALFLPAQGRPQGTILLLHGIGGVREHMLDAAAEYVRAGYNAVVYDSRAHGRSTGRYCTYGYYEKRDVVHVLDEVVRRFGVQERFGILGNSFGGAVALQAMAIDRRIVCGVVESTFASLDDIVYDYQRQMLGIPFRFVARTALREACRLARFDAAEVRPERAAALIDRPVLLAHGEADERIDITYGRRIFRALASPHRQWVSVPGAGHLTLVDTGGVAYRARRLALFRTWLSQPQP